VAARVDGAGMPVLHAWTDGRSAQGLTSAKSKRRKITGNELFDGDTASFARRSPLTRIVRAEEIERLAELETGSPPPWSSRARHRRRQGTPLGRP